MSRAQSSPPSEMVSTTETLRIAEIYVAEQGEGQFAGTPSLFLRTSGCNLRCWYCDTPHTSWQPEGKLLSLESILETVDSHPIEHVVLTGGEPLIQPAIVPLSRELKARKRFVTIETAGTLFRPVTADLVSLSPKLSNSTPEESPWSLRHDQLRHNPSAIQQFREVSECQWKFVIDTPEDIVEVERYLEKLVVPTNEIWLMPQARSQEELAGKTSWIREQANTRGWRFSPRLHIERYGNVRGK